MSRIRLIMLSMLAVFAFAAVASASASAATCEAGDEAKDEYTVCSGAKEFPGTLTNSVKTTKAVLSSTVLGVEVKIECTEGAIENKENGKDNTSVGKISFTKCKVLKPAKGCAVAEPIVAEFTDALSPPPAAPKDTFTGAGEGGAFAAIEFRNNGSETCVLGDKSRFEVTGSQLCTFDTAIATEQKTHEVKCATSGSKLKLGANEAKFSATFTGVEAEGKSWAILES
jgi:hypothetical protein